MKTSIILFITGFFLFIQTGFSQIAKRNMLLGGTAEFKTQLVNDFDDPFNLSLQPNIGYFTGDMFAVGGTFGLNHFKSGDFNGTEFSIGPFARYYIGRFPGEKVWFFLHAKTEYLSTNADFRLSGGNGMSIFFSRSTALEILGVLEYNGGDQDRSRLAILFGFQVYLDRQRE